jgi:chromatin remodeling complex protein RSC6
VEFCDQTIDYSLCFCDQDPNDKKIIICDDKLKKIFGGRDRVGFLEISGLLNPHFQK